jgi:predicted ATPase
MKQFECFALDTANRCLVRNGVPIEMPPKPFAVLRYLVENPGRLITHDELLDALWPQTFVQPQVLRTYVLELRKALGDDAGQPRFIQTLPKRGYRFVAVVTERTVKELCAPAETPAQADPAPVFVGREQELEQLKTQLQKLSSGERRVIFVSGEAGIGKTALVDAFCRQLEPSLAARVARGQCVPGLGAKEEYYPVVEALCRLGAQPGGEQACRILTRTAPAWLGTRSEAEEDAVAAPRPPTRERTLGDLCLALEEMAAEQPLILLIEDLQWADDSTLNLISALARRRASARLLVLATCTPRKGASEGPLKALKEDLLMRRLGAEVVLEPLKKSAVKALLSRELGQEALPAGLADFAYRRAEGNPLFVIAVLEHLISQGVLARRGAESGLAWEQCEPWPEMEAGVPDPLVRMVEVEMERLSEGERRMLEAGSLMSVAFPAWAVAAALGLDAEETEEACNTLARRVHFLVRAGQDELPDGSRTAFYVFAHGVYREVLYLRQSAARRARRHIRIAERLGELFAGREADVAREMAMHYEAGGDSVRAAKVLESSQQRALQSSTC